MAELVGEIMDANPLSVRADSEFGQVIEPLRIREPVSDAERICVGSLSDPDLVIADEEADIHLPIKSVCSKAPVFLESLKGLSASCAKPSPQQPSTG